MRLPDLSSYGDGLVWGAALLLHSLGQTADFRLTDLTTLLLESHQLGWRSTGVHLTSRYLSVMEYVISQLHVCSVLVSHIEQCILTIARLQRIAVCLPAM